MSINSNQKTYIYRMWVEFSVNINKRLRTSYCFRNKRIPLTIKIKNKVHTLPIKFLNSRCRSQILLHQNMALRGLSQSYSKSDFISLVSCTRLDLFLYNSPRFLPISYFSHLRYSLSQQCLFSVFNQS